VILDRSAGKYGTIYGHISRQNPQSKTFSGNQPAVIVFRGPQAYISPTWYARPGLVPTWDFAVVHASGKLKALTDKALDDELAKLIKKFEGLGSSYDFAKLDANEKSRLMSGIIGFEMEIDLLEGKFKLSQERSAADQQGILSKLSTAKPARSMREFMTGFYAWVKAS
jgi:transcriptional regulator